MAQIIIDNGWTFGAVRGAINANFTDLYTNKADLSSVLTKTNTTTYTPTNPYNPATKDYVDQREAAIYARIDPQNIGGDAFARANHTGVQAPATITQDTDNRFVSDLQITTWNAKEDGIGTKNSAFNKDFGTIAGTVSEGNHIHTKADIGLGNVDNTSDDDKPISTAQQAALDLKAEQESEYIDYIPTLTPPAYQIGRLWYDEYNDALSYFNAITDVTLNIGQEVLTRCYNDTGSTIANGAAVHFIGVEPTQKVGKIIPAIATSYQGAGVVGITTTEILDGEYGYICNIGRVHDIDLSLFSTGDVLYLSDTVPGGYQTTPPDFPSVCGGVIFGGSTTDSVMQVFISNNIVRPTAIGLLTDKTGSISVTTSYQDINTYTNEDSIISTIDKTAGYITAPGNGWFRFTVNAVFTVTTSGASRSLSLQVWDVDAAAQVALSTITIPSNASTASRSFAKAVPGIVSGDRYVLRINGSTTISITSIDDISFDMESINVEA